MLFASTGITAGKQKNIVVKTVQQSLYAGQLHGRHWRDIRDDITKEAELAEPEGTVGNGVPASDEHKNDGDRITQILEDDNANDKGIESSRRRNVQSPEKNDDGVTCDVCLERDTEPGIDFGPRIGEGEGLVAGKRPHLIMRQFSGK
jgi:Mg-chelatase subunit ChlI